MQEYLPYAGIIIVVFMFFVQNKLFVTPEQLERKHREILDDCENKFVTLQMFSEHNKKVDMIQNTVQDIHKLLLNSCDCHKKD